MSIDRALLLPLLFASTPSWRQERITLCYILKPHITSFIHEMPEVTFKKPYHKQYDRLIFGFRSRVAVDPVVLRYDADPQVSTQCHVADESNL